MNLVVLNNIYGCFSIDCKLEVEFFSDFVYTRNEEKVILITGPRQIGKTTCLKKSRMGKEHIFH